MIHQMIQLKNLKEIMITKCHLKYKRKMFLIYWETMSLKIWIWSKENKFNSIKEMDWILLTLKIIIKFIIKNFIRLKLICNRTQTKISLSLKMTPSLLKSTHPRKWINIMRHHHKILSMKALKNRRKNYVDKFN